MATPLHHAPQPHKPLLDPHQFEQAGRTVRTWLNRLLEHDARQVDDTIAWEDGEPHPEAERPDQPPSGP